MKPFIACKVYILTDSRGQWWEDIRADGTTRRFKLGTSEINQQKHFKNIESAVKAANGLGYKYYKVVRFSPPIKPSITWNEEILKENLPDFSKGQRVLVKSLSHDMFSNDFVGVIVETFVNDCIVRDQDGDCWTVRKEQVKLKFEE